nr:hypothetical protein REQ54_02097 [Rhizobium sp. Q54]
MDKAEPIIKNAAKTSLEVMQKVADRAEIELGSAVSGSLAYIANPNTFTSPNQIAESSRISRENAESLSRLKKEPLLARVDYEDEDGNPGEIFIAPSAAPAGLGGIRIASHNTAAASIASRKPGTEYTLKIKGREQDVLITAVTKLYPRKDAKDWDSYNSRVVLLGEALTIPSLLRYLKCGISRPQSAEEQEDILARLLAKAEQEAAVISGLVRPEVDGVRLRHETIVDEYQDEIFRMPIDSRLFLSGPPGTGKTTTLIRRLGQKVDLSEGVLTATERTAILRTGDIADHPRSWMLFSPTELLKQYVKENFAREGVPASEDNIKTWNQYRVEMARDYLGLLNTTNRKGLFVLADERPDYLADRCGSSEDAAWYDDFISFFWSSVSDDLASEADALARSPDAAVSAVGKKVSAVLASRRGGLDSRVIADLARFQDELKETIVGLQKAFATISDALLRSILLSDEQFLDKFGKISAELRRGQAEDMDDEDVDDIFDSDEEEEPNNPTAQTVQAAYVRYAKLLRTLASSRSNGKKPGPKTYGGRLAAWLGDTRLPSDEQMKQLALIAGSQRRLRKFLRPDRLIMRAIITKFRTFRAEDALSADWYKKKPPSNSAISWQELDVLMLVTMRVGAEVSSRLDRIPGGEVANRGILADIRALYRNQILVDEVTDFSLIQLALMHELAHPGLHSFFVCGDFNQRLTEWGITADRDLDWISKNFERRSVSISYRQTQKLVDFASAVTALDGSSQNVTLPDFNDIEGIAPVWGHKLPSVADKARWLRARIGEIEARDNRLPSIAVLVNNEEDVQPLASELTKLLREINYSAEACKDGKSIGNEKSIRVFDVQHIKGLEFQAAFFMDMDELIRMKPALFNKYLYVGSTRAATYFGLTFGDEVPPEMVSLSRYFVDQWNVE